MNEQEYLKKLLDEANDTVDLLSHRRKSERERRACAAFLRCLGIDFAPSELVSQQSDPPDVIFRNMSFEVMIVLEKGSTMEADSRKEASRRASAQTLEDLVEPYYPSVAISATNMINRAVTDLARKASRYSPKTCSQLDAMVYVNFHNRHLYPVAPSSVTANLHAQSWRSVCVLCPPYSYVVVASQGAPEFLRKSQGIIKQGCSDPDTWFDL